MSESFPLQPLLDLSNLRLDEAAKKLGQLIASETAAAEKMQLLMTYREEYQSRFIAAAREGLRPEIWSNYQRFIERIDLAIEEAGRLQQQTHQNVNRGRQDWLAQRNRVNAYDTLATRHASSLQQRELRAEQKRSDEFSARAHENKDPQD